ncbi:MAG: FkbM family methyltransferase [Myxococcota bacterium]
MTLRSRLKNVLADNYARLFARPSLAQLNKALVYLGSRGLGIYNLHSDQLSGEESFLASLRREPPQVVFDVGANEGSYIQSVRRHFPRAQIYAFEPHPRTFRRLSQRFGDTASCYNLACDKEAGEFDLFDLAGEEGTQLASLSRDALVPLGREIDAFKVRTTTLDDFCANHGLRRIDLLKIDTEGNERRVLEGAARLLSELRIERIQFEFNEMNVASRSFLKDFIHLLPNHRLFRLLPHGLLPLDHYSPFFNEVFGYQNIVALPRT